MFEIKSKKLICIVQYVAAIDVVDKAVADEFIRRTN